jgi:glycosyltransferase involved in cell wall biosynthesis
LPLGKNIGSTIINYWNRRFCNRCDLIVAPSLFVKKLLEHNGIDVPVEVIPTGLPDICYTGSSDRQWLRNKYNLKPEEKILIYVGRLGKEKNIPFLLEALELIVKQIPPVKLVIVGTGPEEQHLKVICRRRELEKHVIFTGKVDDQELLNCYSGADIFTFASQTETQGLVVAEAKASGLPVVSLFSPTLAEFVFNGKDGFLVHNLHDFVSKILYLLSNDVAVKEMGKKAKIDAIRFSTRLLMNKMLALYHRAIQSKSACQL